MNTNILQHLINLKKYSDYKNTKLDSYRIFINHIENGGPLDLSKSTSTQYDVEDMLDDHLDPTDEEIEQERERKIYEAQKDNFEEYNNSVRDLIERHLSYAQVSLSETMKLGNLYTIITDNKLFVIKQEVFNQWLSIAENYLANMFFKNLIELEQQGVKISGVNTIEGDIEPYEEIFVSQNAYLVFKSFVEGYDKSNPREYGYIYHKMLEKDLIIVGTKNGDYDRWLSKRGIKLKQVLSKAKCYESKTKKDERFVDAVNLYLK